MGSTQRHWGRRKAQIITVSSRYEETGGPVVGLTVYEEGPRAAVIAKLRSRYSQVRLVPTLRDEIHEPIEVTVQVDGKITDRFTRAADGTYRHDDLIAGRSAVLARQAGPSAESQALG